MSGGAAIRGVTIDRCSAFWVGATGSAGSRARLLSRAKPRCRSA
jgi:hypothetical protein